jgi:hypothetical protein
MSAPLTGQDIINKFHLYTGDQSELSTSDELDLLNKVYDDVLNQMPWEFLKKQASGTIQFDGTNYYIQFPADYRYLIENNQETNNSQTTYNNASQKVIFVGPNYTIYQIQNWSDRRQQRGSSYFIYPDLANSRFIFTGKPIDTTYEFDYIKNWDALTLNTSPIFTADVHDMLYHLMAVDSMIINLFDKARSYAKENQQSADQSLSKLKYLNSMQTFN